ncbi:hypothetical protein BHWA1_01351 [Brachyspira hyodysenteriae WA1]|uniref:Uncharacterized protein n=1 Tax=Brachyspira hyodysenteriae (strain ATCC 49526 / WA1) TaxID=565034 RepID=A0A3B6V9S4_BRAHW|nr:hypothetical protein BHWA1_01351 [Brachyspira hyodysenteriae WA1]
MIIKKFLTKVIISKNAVSAIIIVSLLKQKIDIFKLLNKR